MGLEIGLIHTHVSNMNPVLIAFTSPSKFSTNWFGLLLGPIMGLEVSPADSRISVSTSLGFQLYRRTLKSIKIEGDTHNDEVWAFWRSRYTFLQLCIGYRLQHKLNDKIPVDKTE